MLMPAHKRQESVETAEGGCGIGTQCSNVIIRVSPESRQTEQARMGTRRGSGHNKANLRIIRRRLRHVISRGRIISLVRDLSFPKLLLPHHIISI